MNLHVGNLGHITIKASPYCERWETKQVRFPRSKRKRIRKKWARDGRNWETKKVSYMVVMGGSVMMSQDSIDRLFAALPVVRP